MNYFIHTSHHCLRLLKRKLHLYFSLTRNKNTSLTGAKSIAKAMKKVASGSQIDEGIKRFSKLRYQCTPNDNLA